MHMQVKIKKLINYNKQAAKNDMANMQNKHRMLSD